MTTTFALIAVALSVLFAVDVWTSRPEPKPKRSKFMRQYQPDKGVRFQEAVLDAQVLANEYDRCLLVFNNIPVVIEPTTTIAEADYVWSATGQAMRAGKEAVRPQT